MIKEEVKLDEEDEYEIWMKQEAKWLSDKNE